MEAVEVVEAVGIRSFASCRSLGSRRHDDTKLLKETQVLALYVYYKYTIELGLGVLQFAPLQARVFQT